MPTIQVDGLEIGYDRAGEGPPILLLHGAACSALSWKPQLDGLADEFTVIAWDEPGAGRSSDLPDEGLGFADYAAAAAALIDRIGAGPAHVCGLSWGGVLAQELYRHYPEVVATLILCDTYAGWAGSLTKQEVESRIALVEAALSSSQLKTGLPGGFASEPPAEYADLASRMEAEVRPRTLRGLLDHAWADTRELLGRIAVPTKLIWGDADVRSPLSIAEQFAAAIPDAELTLIAGAGHDCNIERPAEFNAAVRAFCRANSEPATCPKPAHSVSGGRSRRRRSG